MGESNSTKMPQSPRGEMALTLAKIGVSFIPVAGGAASDERKLELSRSAHENYRGRRHWGGGK